MANLISSLSAQISFYNYKVNALCVVGIEAAVKGKNHLANAVNKEALALLDYCNCLREAKALLRQDKKIKAEISALFGKACYLEQVPSSDVDYLSYIEEDDWDNEPTFGQQLPKQEVDDEDSFVSMEKIKSLNIDAYFAKGCYFKFKNSKNRSKWARSGRAARVLSNR